MKGVAIFATGFGSRVSALSLISHSLPDPAKATAYACITVLESLGHAVGDPGMQYIFAASMNFGGVWMGMPFFVAAVRLKFVINDGREMGDYNTDVWSTVGVLWWCGGMCGVY